MSNTQQPEALNLEEFRAKVTSAAREPLLARIAELEAQLAAIGAGGVEPLRKQAAPAALAASDERKAFDAANLRDYFGGPLSYRERDIAFMAWQARASLASTPVAGELATLQAGLQAAAPAHPAEGVPAQAAQPSDALIEAVDDWFAENTGLGGCSDKDVSELAEIFATHPTQQGMDAQTIKRISALSELVRMPNAEHFADAHNAAVRHLRALAAQAQQGEQAS